MADPIFLSEGTIPWVRPTSKFAPHEKITLMFPIQPGPDQSTLVRWSKLKLFPPYFRPGNRKTPPLWNIDECQKWIEEKYSPMFDTAKHSGNAKRKSKST